MLALLVMFLLLLSQPITNGNFMICRLITVVAGAVNAAGVVGVVGVVDVVFS